MNPQFDHERLDVYRLELDFIAWVTPLLEEIKTTSGARVGEVSDQLDRASLSALLNTAEGNGKRKRQVRAKFFDDARGSATECAAGLDALVAKVACSPERIADGKDMLWRIVSMLTKLVQLYSEDATTLREESSSYSSSSSSSAVNAGETTDYEDENEDEDDLRNA